jgi:Holliday junction resolvase RusA-like endonuclease
MKSQSITIPGQPVPQKRHRSVRVGGGLRSYDPSAADKRRFASLAIADGLLTWHGPLHVQLEFGMVRPKAHFRKGILREDAPSLPTGRPDLDNLIKFVLDALNSLAWPDDSAIVSLHATKIYLSEPQTYLKITQK